MARVRTTDDNNKAGNSQFDEPSRADLTFRVFFIVSRMSPQRIRDIQLKSKHLDSEGGKTSSRVKGLRRKKNRATINGESYLQAPRERLLL